MNNEHLMQRIVVCFDVDGTLINGDDMRYDQIINMVSAFSQFKNVKVVVWSGGGQKYASRQVERLGLEKFVWKAMSKTQAPELKSKGYRIIAIDDIHSTRLGELNLIVRNK